MYINGHVQQLRWITEAYILGPFQQAKVVVMILKGSFLDPVADGSTS